ncbi:hypothetical protein GH714_023512 [Hevea brasiliensis]|uniref:Leucine-rich repeat-containing N-terminal plant-type domain-containing protein n=1 Tax=Hevea brasiliensis TaxID=3981 RepID=A0A6A6LMM8_HEVBR|nr:hypothetical protein GH714_023512 [Hevea brasiliensis]
MNGCGACLEEERIGLLEFKAFLKSNCLVFDNLDSWVDGMSDCCGWDRVECNTTSRRVIDLSLGDVVGYCSLNLSMLHPFEELLSLNLSGNGFYGWIDQAEWVDLFVREMMSATSVDDARAVPQGCWRFWRGLSENLMLKEHIEVLMQENSILKRAVAIQHERQKEFEDKHRELQQLASQYQQQLKTLEVNNYALMMHLRQAQQSSPIPGRFHPDVF